MERSAERTRPDAEAVAQEEPPPAILPAPSPAAEVSHAVRAGEDVLRTTAGGLVLRRHRRSFPAPDPLA
jgi:hypothetical protein